MGTTNQAEWQEAKNNKQNEIDRLKRIYYDADENLVLPKHPRYYYDWLCSRYKSYPMVDKLRDLGFQVSQGFDLKRSVREYKKEREENITEAIPKTFLIYILYMRYGVSLHYTDFKLRKLSERKLINLFIDEVNLRFDLSNLEVKIGCWKNEELLELSGGDKQTFLKLIPGMEMTKKWISA